MRTLFVLMPLLLLASCGRQADNQPGPGGVTVGEAKALDEAAEMLEQRRLPPEALRPPASAAPSTGPAAAPAETSAP